jgi:rhodanese-related sulfurtransferase
MITRIVVDAVKQAIIISVIVVVVGLVFNALRPEGIPLIADAGTFRIQTDAEFMKVDDAIRLFEDGDVVFVDARDARVFSQGHVEGALNIPPTQSGVDELSWFSDVESSIVCYASEESQRQAGVVADKIIEMGARQVFILYGGFEAWKEAGQPVGMD